jgi:hypothetical protein
MRTRDPIPLPQRLRLLCAAKRVERIGGDAGAVLVQIVVSSECVVVCAESGFAEGERFTWLAPIARARLSSSRAPAKSRAMAPVTPSLG